MPDRMLIKPDPPRQRWILLLIIAACVAVLVIFRLQGLLLILPILAVAMLVMSRRPDTTETLALRFSITLSAEDIEDVIAEFDRFATGTDAEAIADRTLNRPALLDLDCTDPDIAAFHHEYATARRLQDVLKNFHPIPPNAVPGNSILREYIGGSVFQY